VYHEAFADYAERTHVVVGNTVTYHGTLAGDVDRGHARR